MKLLSFTYVATALGGGVAGLAVGLSFGAPDWFEPVLGGLVTMVATFIGARYAFYLTEQREHLKSDEANVELGNKVIFSLILARNNFATIRRQAINEARPLPDRHLRILPSGSLGSYQMHTVAEALQFISPSDPLIVNELTQLEMEIVTTLQWIERRSEKHIEFQNRMDNVDLGPDETITLEDLKRRVGPRLYAQLKSLTDDMIEGIDRSIETCDRLIPRLNGALRAKYPKQKILRMDLPAQQVR